MLCAIDAVISDWYIDFWNILWAPGFLIRFVKWRSKWKVAKCTHTFSSLNMFWNKMLEINNVSVWRWLKFVWREMVGALKDTCTCEIKNKTKKTTRKQIRISNSMEFASSTCEFSSCYSVHTSIITNKVSRR